VRRSPSYAARNATTSTGSASLKLNRDPLGSPEQTRAITDLCFCEGAPAGFRAVVSRGSLRLVATTEPSRDVSEVPRAHLERVAGVEELSDAFDYLFAAGPALQGRAHRSG
jgi:hypothetical protein